MANHFNIFSNFNRHLFFSILLTVISILFSSQTMADDTNSQWKLVTQPVYKSNQKKELIGNGWLVSTRQGPVGLAFKLTISKNAQYGAWLGIIRTTVNFHGLDLSFLDSKNQTIKLQHERMRKIKSYSVGKGSQSVKIHVFHFPVKWDGIAQLLSAKAIDIRYRTIEEPKVVKHRMVSTEGLKLKLEELSKSVQSHPERRFYVLKQSQINSIAIGKLPVVFKKSAYLQINIKRLGSANKVKVSDEEVEKYSLNQINTLIDERKKLLIAKRKEAYKAIYDQEPNWMDMNLCPKPDLYYCRNVGQQGEDVEPILWGTAPYKYGKIQGVIWRSKHSIIRISGGTLDLNSSIEPKIIRANKAGYYYLFFDKKGRVNYVVHVDSIKVK